MIPTASKTRETSWRTWQTTLRAPCMSTSISLWLNTTQIHLIPVIRLQIAWLQDKHEHLFTRRKAHPEGSARWKLWFSRVNKSACVRTLPCYKCFIILNQQRTEKKSRSSSKSTSPKLFIWWRHRHNIVLKIRITLGTRLILHRYIVARINFLCMKHDIRINHVVVKDNHCSQCINTCC